MEHDNCNKEEEEEEKCLFRWIFELLEIDGNDDDDIDDDGNVVDVGKERRLDVRRTFVIKPNMIT